MRNNHILKQVGDTLRDLRKQKHLSQEELGERAGFHFSYIGKMERGEVNITLVNLERISTALGVGLHQFFPFSYSEDKLTEKEKFINAIATNLRSHELAKIKTAKNIIEELLK